MYVEQVRAGDDTCTDWPFSTFIKSGRAAAMNPRTGKLMMAGRVTWERYHGQPWPEGMQARHTCGNGHLACANPRHIVPGTHAENVADRARDGRDLKGEKNPNTTSTNAQIITACYLVADGVPLGEAAAQVGLSTNAVSRAWRGAAWTHLDMPRKGSVVRECDNCGAALSLSTSGRRRFCDDRCSWTFHNAARREARTAH